ncbi:MAG: FAD-dependent thymidylate synthase [Planctomycetes bacterium]|nr:FAD-dependent thymidylate synthase [Planctomycetota bacterium]
MELIKASYKILTELNGQEVLKEIEKAGRTAYKSEDKITETSAANFVKAIIKRGHHSVLEHKTISVRFVADRGCTHCIVRYRMSSFTQESTRYVNYHKRGMRFIIPPWVDLPEGEITQDDETQNCPVDIIKSSIEDSTRGEWIRAVSEDEIHYRNLLKKGWTPEQARTVLPNSVAAEIVMTTNIREWRHFLSLEMDKAAHPQMRDLLIPLLLEFKTKLPILFDDILPEQ